MSPTNGCSADGCTAAWNASEASFDVARSVLMHEAHALSRMAEKLVENKAAMQRAVCLACMRTQGGSAGADASGKIVMVGVGKSGHVARKLSSTLMSLGTRAVFLHPTEALHGDIGVLNPAHDVVMALSYSGESPEVVGFMELPQVQACARIVMTANAHARLLQYSDVWLDCSWTPSVPSEAQRFTSSQYEASPDMPAPTTSTTSMMALGDAFSMALTHAKGVQRSTFLANHPGGHLGQVLPQGPAAPAVPAVSAASERAECKNGRS